MDKKSMGKKSRRSGKLFENQVRVDLCGKGYTVCKWTNTVDITEDKIVPAKSKYNPFTKRVMSEGSGFPDYVCMKRLSRKEIFNLLKENKGTIVYPPSKRGAL